MKKRDNERNKMKKILGITRSLSSSSSKLTKYNRNSPNRNPSNLRNKMAASRNQDNHNHNNNSMKGMTSSTIMKENNMMITMKRMMRSMSMNMDSHILLI